MSPQAVASADGLRKMNTKQMPTLQGGQSMSRSRSSLDASHGNLSVPIEGQNPAAVHVINDDIDNEGSQRFTIDNFLQKNNDESGGSLIRDQSARQYDLRG